MRTADSGRFAFFDVDGPQFVLEDHGWRRRQTLIAVPAGPGFSHKTLRPWLTGLASTVRTVYLDLPGSGRASREPQADFTFPAFVNDLDAVRSRVDSQNPVILGHGWGAALAIEYALARPAHVSALVLVSPLRYFNLSSQDTEAQTRQVERTDSSLGPRFARDVMPAFEAAMTGRGPWEPVEKSRWWSEMLLTQFVRQPPKAWFTSLGNEPWGIRAYAAYKGATLARADHPIASYDLTLRASGLPRGLPVLIVSSNHDANYVAKADTHAAPLHHALSASELLIWDDVGHFPFIERPEEFVAAITGFLARRADTQ
ncbi:MAG: alpha/beta fold hydrolase [Proteobacteria bacterium]|nr:alpha/beta fold hydrolase [Pseudomonadota bacterium]